MATIRIKPKPGFFNRPGNFQIYIDGNRKSSNYYVESEAIEVPAGRHSLIVKSMFVSSQELSFEIKETESKTFEVGIFKLRKFLYPFLLILVFVPFLELNAYLKYSVFLLIPVLLVSIYYSTFGRKEYFTLEESHSYL